MAEYGIFLLKTVTILIAILAVVVMIASVSQKQKSYQKGHIEIHRLNKRFKAYKSQLEDLFLSKAELKKAHKAEAKAKKQLEKSGADKDREKIFVINFKGDMQAHAVESLREEVTTILSSPEKPSEVILRLESPGGAVHGYGLAASQLVRLRDQGIKLTVCVDKVAASGGYMMACVADKVLSAPFAIVGSIGVVSQLPNINRLLKKHDIDVEMHTAGEFKRTLTVIGENTDEGRKKFKEELNEIHRLFKGFVQTNRPVVDIDAVATGEFWLGQDALENKLVDEIKTSDQYLLEKSSSADLYEIQYKIKKSLADKLGKSVTAGVQNSVENLVNRLPF